MQLKAGYVNITGQEWMELDYYFKKDSSDQPLHVTKTTEEIGQHLNKTKLNYNVKMLQQNAFKINNFLDL